MARYIQIQVGKERTATGTHFLWPQGWFDSHPTIPGRKLHEQAHVVAYQDEGGGIEGAIAVVDDQDIALFTALGGVTEIDAATADSLGQVWRLQQIIVSDTQAIVAEIELQLPAMRGLQNHPQIGQLLKMLDPDDPAPGVRRTPLFHIIEFVPPRRG